MRLPRRAPAAIEHSTYVQMKAPGGFFASCRTCGCDPFPDRVSLGVAEADAERHGTLRHGYALDVLEAHERATMANLPLT